MITCIDLKETFGQKYRIAYDESAGHEAGGRNDPWLMLIPCHRGHIYPHGGNLLAVATATRGGTAKAIRALPGVEVVQDGEDGINATFPVELFPQVAELMKPHRRRQFSDQERERIAALGREHRFEPGHGAKSRQTKLERVRTASPV